MVQRFVAATRHEVSKGLERAWHTPGDELFLDLSATTAIDSVGAALLGAFAQRAQRAGRTVRVTGLSADLAHFLKNVPFPAQQAEAPAGDTALEALGGWGYASWQSLIHGLVLASELAYFALDALRGRARRVRGLRLGAILREMEEMGAQAVPVVCLIAFLVGLTIALQSAAQLRPYGAVVYVVDLIGVSVTRELGPLLAAIIVAGRSGSACAAQVATMVVTEEVDALRAMGIEPSAYTVLPKLIAIVLVQPMVALCACAAAIGGALLVGVFALDISDTAFLLRLSGALEARDLFAGVFKSMVFGALIVLVAARSGYSVQGGAEGVGHSTTRSVVLAIFCIIAADAAFSFVLYSGDN